MTGFKKKERKVTMSICVTKTLREDVVRIAEREKIPVSSVMEQLTRLAIENNLIKK